MGGNTYTRDHERIGNMPVPSLRLAHHILRLGEDRLYRFGPLGMINLMLRGLQNKCELRSEAVGSKGVPSR